MYDLNFIKHTKGHVTSRTRPARSPKMLSFALVLIVKGMYEVSRSAVLLDGEKSNMFSVEQGVYSTGL